ncbi:hypothetical protein Q8F55_000910 [Vanrija albida]|uniref:Helicase C-terminal domain-containing protein n=1 Tax=Vanrija albida TaxID=181172 RepID=A0ABR3QFN8_9TREE
MKRAGSINNILMELRKVCQHPYLADPSLENLDLSPEEQQKRLTDASGKLLFLKKLLPSLKRRGRRVLLFSQFKMALDRIEDFLIGEGYKYLRLDGDVSQVRRQKDMDKFNAENSDYFIFLLTTRAGGVGINLATADAVVVYDPDFNPHQDLQAIARSHRYGQKKPVLVFKLMSENAVESRIMANGKKKLVLDHLVVQKMGQETEEGELDDLLLYGAEAISKADETTQDRIWTTQKVEELIDGAEKEAEEEAKRLDEREKEKEREAAKGKSGTKETMGFSFAKVWETNEGQRRDAVDQEDSEEPQDFDENSWLTFVENADKELERQRQEALEAQMSKGRLRRKTQPKSYVIDDEPDTPKKKGRKGKGKEATPDNDFVAPVQDSDSEDEVSDEIDFSDLNEGTRNSLGGMLAGKLSGKQKLTKHERELLRAHQQGKKLAASMANEPAATATAGPGPSTLAHASVDRADEILQRMQNLADHPPTQVPVTVVQEGILLVPNGTPTAVQPQIAPPANPARTAHHANKMSLARDMLRTLAEELISSPHVKNQQAITGIWGSMVDVGGPLSHRETLYKHLAGLADQLRKQDKRPPLYMIPATVQLAKYFFNTDEPIWDRSEADRRRPQPQWVPVTQPQQQPAAGVAPRADVQLQMPQPQYAAGANPLRNGAQLLSQNRADGHAAQANGSATNPAHHQEKAPAAEPAPAAPAAPAAPSRPLSAGTSGPAPSRTTISLTGNKRPSEGKSAQPPSALQLGDSSRFDIHAPKKGDDECYWCNEHHALRDCPNLVPEEDLETFRDQILQGDELPEDKQKGLDAVEKMLVAHRERRKLARRPSSRASNKSRDAAGSKRRPIDLDGDANDRPAVVKRPRPSDNTGNEYQPFQGCAICRSEVFHSTSQCPVVKAGPESIEEALKRFTPSDSVYPVLKQILRVLKMGRTAATTCPYCGLRCGQAVRACVEERGTRKDLKGKIRVLEDEMGGYNARIDRNTEAVRALGNIVAGTPAHTQAEVLRREIHELNRHLERVREVIDPLYKAYLEWPKD